MNKPVLTPLVIEYRRPVELIPYINNAKQHEDAQIAQIAASIKEFGFTNPILLDGDSGVIAGHGRLLAAQKLQLEQVPTVELAHLSDTQRRAYILADNRLAEVNTSWDFDLVSTELEALELDGFDVDLTGFDDGFILTEPEEGLTDEDEVPDVPDEPVTVLGDIWLLGNHRLMCGDSTSVDTVDSLMAGSKADVVFTDPPYGMALNTDYSGMVGNFKGIKGGNTYAPVKGDNSDFSASLINTVFANFAYCKEVFLWGADYYSEHLPDKNSGSWVVWDKRLNESADKMFGSTFELCWSRSKHKRILARVKWAGIFGMAKEHDKKRSHPTQKPVALTDWFLDYFSLENAVNVVDLYGGSGSTLLACEKASKHCFMAELDEKYCDVILNRWQDYTGKQATLEGDGRTFDEIKSERVKPPEIAHG